MDEDVPIQNTTHPLTQEPDEKDKKIQELEVDINKKDEQILELEGEISKKEEDIEDADQKSQTKKLDLDSNGEKLIKRIRHALCDKISQTFLNKWDYCEVIQDEVVIYKPTKEETSRVEIELQDIERKTSVVIGFLNSRGRRQLEYLQIDNRTQLIKVARKMVLKETHLKRTQNNMITLDDDIESFKSMFNGVIKL